MKMNYELIYKVRQKRLNVCNPNNLRIRYENEAKRRAEQEHSAMRSELARMVGSDELEFTAIVCMADGIMNHVYHPTSEPSGVGKRKCIFCGCDDFD